MTRSRAQRAIEQVRCERGAAIARKVGFDEAVGAAILDLHEHWDGGGHPRGLDGADIHRHARILAACPALDLFLSSRAASEALAVMRARRGSWYDPDIVDALLDACDDGLLDELPSPDLVGRTMALEPDERAARSRTTPTSTASRGAFADIVDAKSPFTGSHSQRVARMADGVARRLGLPERDVVDVRRAGLLHDLGKLGVPNIILDKPARLEPSEIEVIRRHPELTLRILEPVPSLATVAEMAACHHERLDGTRLLPRHDRAGAGDGGPDRGGRRRLRGADGGPAVPRGDADRPGARDHARVRGRPPRRRRHRGAGRHRCRERRPAPAAAGPAAPGYFANVTRNSSVPSSAIETMNPPMFGAVMS